MSMDLDLELRGSGWRRLPPWIRGLVILGTASALLAWPFHALLKDDRIARNERAASAALKQLAAAEADVRVNDRDGNAVQDFWTGDVSGLARFTGGLDPAIAAADACPAVPRTAPAVPYHGYYFVALQADESGTPYRQDTGGTGANGARNRNPGKFAFCAYPAAYGVTGRHTFSVNEGNTVLKHDLRGRPRDAWPPDAELTLEYAKID
jgi:hypothetical protein